MSIQKKAPAKFVLSTFCLGSMLCTTEPHPMLFIKLFILLFKKHLGGFTYYNG